MRQDLFDAKQPVIAELGRKGLEADDVRDYIVEMIDQLSGLAADQGEALLAAMLAEVSRRQKLFAAIAADRRPTH